MRNVVLTLLECSGIQDYVFGSNNLSVNIGASELVDRVTRDWLLEALPEPNNLLANPAELHPSFKSELKIEDGDLMAEVIYRGGGNALILFLDMEKAKAFSNKLTLKALQEAPGLQVVVAHHEFDWDAPGQFRNVFQDILRPQLAKRKVDRPRSTPLPGLGVTAACVFTGQPATQRAKTSPAEGRPTLFSDEVAAKLEAATAANERLHKLLPQVKQKNFVFVYDFDHFGSHGEYGYIAVVHSDGNSMGKRIENHLAGAKMIDNRICADALRIFSEKVTEGAMKALNETVNLLIESQVEAEIDGKLVRVWMRSGLSGPARERALKVRQPYLARSKQPALPFRPLVFGGDDVTFVCDGRLGLALAKAYLQHSFAQNLADDEPAYCRAGVAVVKSHYPFSRAYELAEDLSGTTKKNFKASYPEVVGLDWHFATSGLVLGMSEIRQREYNVEAGELLMRPVRVNDPGGSWRIWSEFEQLVSTLQVDPEWSGRRNKLKALREALRCGTEAVEQFRRYYLEGKPLPKLKNASDSAIKTGWESSKLANEPDRCVYFDAIEAMDFYIPLEGKSAQGGRS